MCFGMAMGVFGFTLSGETYALVAFARGVGNALRGIREGSIDSSLPSLETLFSLFPCVPGGNCWIVFSSSYMMLSVKDDVSCIEAASSSSSRAKLWSSFLRRAIGNSREALQDGCSFTV